ncbi:aspartic proteinase CDR1 [Cucumis sativus]|nr:aspartic proteinase CDR1 [Cucumis sativus]KAE8650377.1 hypothetical protein Csa_011170 [Cucumis sativus]
MSPNHCLGNTILFLLFTIFESKGMHMVSNEVGFTARLIHHDSPLSPFYNHTMTDTARIEATVHRSRSRLNYLYYINKLSENALDNDVSLSPTLVNEGGEYLMSFNIGNPSSQVMGFLDTSNGLIWVQCSNCNSQCEPEKRGLTTKFLSSKSFTYEMEPCGSNFCNSLTGFQTCNSSDKWCKYRLVYGDNKATSGILSSDSFGFDTSDGMLVDVGFLNFGCSEAPLTGDEQSYTGNVGLNQTPLSLISQLGIKKFSYCLVPFNNLGSTSKMYFGSLPVTSGGQTPLLYPNSDAYYVKVLGISIGNDEPHFDGVFDVYEVRDGWIIDTGITYSSLETDAFDSLLAKFLTLKDFPQRKDDPKERFELCFELQNANDLESFPDVTVHFDGADLILNVESTFVKIEDDGIFCLALLRSGSPVSILGNFQLQNYHVGYDLEAQVISFAPVDCADS